MTLSDLMVMLRKDLVVGVVDAADPTARGWRYGFHASIRDVELLKNHLLGGETGFGETIIEAIADHCQRISGQVIVLHPTDPVRRREFNLPVIQP